MSGDVFPQPAPNREIDIDNIPLFMKSLPSEDADDSTLKALQSLIYEGTPDDIAQNFKDQGNECFKEKRIREALGFYAQGLDAKPTDIFLREALLCNRAACNLELKNYGSALRDCSQALTLNTRSSKAYYRSAVALLALERLDEALDSCDRCLAFDSDNEGVKSIRERILKKQYDQNRKEREERERMQKERESQDRLMMAFKERNLMLVKTPEGTQDSPYTPHFSPEDPTQSTLTMPVMFLYPQHAISDTITHFFENTTFSEHISLMFPPEAPAPDWDKSGEYTASQLVVYAMTRRRRLLKVGKKMTLRDVCIASKGKSGEPADGLEVKGGFLSFAVLPKGDVEQKWASILIMSVNHKILRTANAPTTSPDETETSVAQALIDLENNVPELKAELRPLQISAAREVDVRGGKKAIVVFVPVPQLKAFRKVQQRLTRELEKKFSDRHVVFVAQRRMLSKPTRNSRVKQKRPRTRTLTHVHEKILEDLVFPTEIVGKRTRVAVDGSKLLKVILDSKDATSLEYKLDSFSSVYRRLTGKDVVFEFPPTNQE
ncbi:40S ribosomal protein S7 [Hygrophoropsis aurantiaca]|uniref:40S ribosomal protein S7 n=1 Tax=Hygrophoropsis aurantiaca TaxID=72124 RepID=A0ACB8ANS5_9AGAM|nr:40S ribosomal protein S7 [Hygrophoropsis aurantiaca]